MLHKINDKFSMALTYVCAVFLVIVVLVITANILLRTIFNAPISGTIEFVQYSVMAIAVMILSRTCFEDKHIYVPVLTDKMPYAVRMVVYAIGRFLSAAAFAVMTYEFFIDIPSAMVRVTDILRLPYYIILIVMAVGMLIATIAFILQGIHFIALIKENKEKEGEAK